MAVTEEKKYVYVCWGVSSYSGRLLRTWGLPARPVF